MNFESEQKESNIEIIRRVIAESPQEVEREYKNTPNTWLACVITRLQAIVAHLEFAEEEGEISAEEAQKYRARRKSLTDYIRELKGTYVRKEDEVPEEIKREILQRLDILRE
ncbi:hypothetical protein EPN83_00250 [Patescibacteria group bacterium]|nr:MAG: hypothetical protein EPN83_00250 [Patescibacteria group bacterium]